MVEEGADLLDVGGESTRPGAAPLAEAEERRRVLPVVEGLAARVQRPDLHRHLQGGDRRCRAGGGRGDGQRHQRPALRARRLPRSSPGRAAPIVLMHTRGRSRDMYEQAVYHDVVDEVLDELRESIAFAAGAGVPKERILVDPGLGFAKEPAHSYEVLARLHEFAELGRPMLVGPSRKTFLTRPLGQGRSRRGARLGDGGRGRRRGLRRRAHRSRARRARDGAGGPGRPTKFGSIIATGRNES